MTKTLYPSNLQILQEIEAIMAAPSAQAMDTDRLEACLLELQSRAPVMEDYDADAAWKKLQASLTDELVEAPAVQPHSTKTFTRTVRILIAVAAILAAIMVTAAALGMKSFLRLVSWEDDRIIFQSVLSDDVIQRYNQVTEFATLTDALAEEDQAIDLLPTQLPEGYALTSVTRTKQLGATTYAAKYHKGKQQLSLTIRVGKHKSAIYLVPSAAQAYTDQHNGIDFTVYTLDGHWHALWQSGTVNYSLSAPITESELLAVLNSIK